MSVLRCTYTLQHRTLSSHLELDRCTEREKFMYTEKQGEVEKVVDDKVTRREREKKRDQTFLSGDP